MKRIIRLFFIVLMVVGIIGIPVWYYVVKPKIEEYNYVGFMQDKEDPEMAVYRTKEHTHLYGTHVIDNKTYYFDENTGAMQTGFVSQNDGVHYYDESGVMCTGILEINGDTYHLDETSGVMHCQVFEKKGENTVYFNEEGKLQKGKKEIEGKERLFDENGTLIPDMEYLQNGVQEVLSQYGGDISVYFKDLKSGNSFVINDHDYYPCCMIKVPSLITIYNCIRDGKIQKTQEVAYWIDLMIRISDNTAFNSLMCLIGGGDGVQGVNLVTQTAHEIGMENTYAKHGLMPGEKFFSAGGANQSCAKDLGIAFEKIYQHEVATPELCNEMIEILKSCDDYEELLAGLPSDVPFAHKTGCAYALYHDGGIVHLDGREYILVCFSDQANYTRMMPALSAFVYQYQKDLDPLG